MTIAAAVRAFARPITLHAPTAFVATFAVTLGYVIAVGVHPQYMRDEAGWFLTTAARGPDAMADLVRYHLAYSYNSHYTPLAFAVELVQARIFGAHESAWLARQALVIAALAFVLFRLLRTMVPASIAFAATVVFIIQPFMLDMATNPFMVMQLGFLILFALTATLLLDLARRPNPRTLWWTVAAGYATMHVLGTGLAVAVSLWFCLLALYVSAHVGSTVFRPHIPRALAVLGALIVAHGAMMLRMPPGVAPGGADVGLGMALARFGGLLALESAAALRALWAPFGFWFPDVASVTSFAALGWALVGGMVIVGVRFARAYQRMPTPERRAQTVAYGFSAGTLLLIIALMVARVQRAPDAAMAGFLMGGRYLVIVSTLTFVALASAAMRATWPPVRVASAVAVVASFACTLSFVHSVEPSLWPAFAVSDDRVMAAASAYLSAGSRTGLPVEDIDMFADGFGIRLRQYAVVVQPGGTVRWGSGGGPAMDGLRDALIRSMR